MKNSRKKASIKPLCSAKSVLDDLSSSPLFEQSEELQEVYSSLVRSFFNTSQINYAEAYLRPQFEKGILSVSNLFLNKYKVGSGAISFAWTNEMSNLMNQTVTSGSNVDKKLIANAAYSCGYIGAVAESFVEIHRSNITGSNVDNYIKEAEKRSKSYFPRFSGGLTPWLEQVFKEVGILTGETADSIKSMMNSSSSNISGFVMELGHLMGDDLEAFVRGLVPNSITEYQTIVDKAGRDLTSVMLETMYLYSNIQREAQENPTVLFAKYPKADIELFLQEFEPVESNPILVSEESKAIVEAAITNSVTDSSLLFDGSGTKPNYVAAQNEVMSEIQASGSKYMQLYLSCGVSYVLNRGQ